MVLQILFQLLGSKLGAVLQASCLQIWSDRRLLGDCDAAGYFIKVLARAFSRRRGFIFAASGFPSP
jgi:hypothetical protein